MVISKRRKPGDFVRKKAGAGFSLLAGRAVIPHHSEPDRCCLCDDLECQEWADVWPVDAKGVPTGGNWCHVSECQMEDDHG